MFSEAEKVSYVPPWLGFCVSILTVYRSRKQQSDSADMAV